MGWAICVALTLALSSRICFSLSNVFCDGVAQEIDQDFCNLLVSPMGHSCSRECGRHGLLGEPANLYRSWPNRPHLWSNEIVSSAGLIQTGTSSTYNLFRCVLVCRPCVPRTFRSNLFTRSASLPLCLAPSLTRLSENVWAHFLVCTRE